MTSEGFWKFILSLSVAFPAIAGLIRFRKIETAYWPFIIYLTVSLLNELLMGLWIIPKSRKAEALDWTLFNLFEAVILMVQFYYWKRFDRYKKIFPGLLIVVVCGWFFENFIAHNIYHFSPIFLICYSFILVLLSVQTINYIIVNEARMPITKNAMFIICVAMIVFFVYDIFVWTLAANGIHLAVYDIYRIVNTMVNLLYGLGVCFIPKKISGKDLFRDLYIN
jgi:hypothetical protein